MPDPPAAKKHPPPEGDALPWLDADPETLDKPTLLTVALLLDGHRSRDWHRGTEKTYGYVLTHAVNVDEHLRGLCDRLLLLEADLGRSSAEDCYSALAEVDLDLDFCLSDYPHSFSDWVAITTDRPDSDLAWKPRDLLRLAEGRMARGEGDPKTLAGLVESARRFVAQSEEILKRKATSL